MRGYPEHLHEVINEDLQESIYDETLEDINSKDVYGWVYSKIMQKFKDMFPAYVNGVNDFRPQDGESYAIHIWMKDGRELVFKYENESHWLFETYEHFKMRKSS